MAVKSDYVSGTISLTNGSASFSGTGTGWLAAGFREGDTIIDITGATEYMGVIASIDANGSGTLTKPWEGPTLTDAAYRMRYQPDGSRVSAQARNLVELLGNGNLQAVAGLEGSANRLPMFTGPGAMTLVSKADLTSGADYDVQVDDLAARAAYDGMDQGFAVLVANTGDGRAAIYSKVSNAVGDWSDPAYVTGAGYDLSIGDVEQIPYGEPPKVTLTPSGGGGALNFDLPKGMIIEPGTITTLGPGQDATWDWVPITGGYRVDLSIPQGETGDINGVTPFWQTRITQDTDAATARDGLGATTVGAGLFTAADAAAARALINALGVGDYGWGGTSITVIDSGSWDDIVTGGFYSVTGSVTNGPVLITCNALVIPNDVGGGRVTQIAMQVNSDAMWIRRQNNGSWSDWRQIYNQGNILGTVSETSGVPTGAVIERGSNANGEYVRYADGTQICTNTVTATWADPGGSLDATFTFAAAFAAAPSISFVADSDDLPNAVDRSIGQFRSVGTTSVIIRVGRGAGSNFSSGTTCSLRAMAIGRWF